jgi:hypothetical protein
MVGLVSGDGSGTTERTLSWHMLNFGRSERL